MSEFDSLIEEAAALPREYGYAPSTAQLFDSVEARQASRKKMFNSMDLNSSGVVSLGEWITFALEHIEEKV